MYNNENLHCFEGQCILYGSRGSSLLGRDYLEHIECEWSCSFEEAAGSLLNLERLLTTTLEKQK